MSAIEVTTQAKLDWALRGLRDGDWIVCLGGTWDRPLRAYDSATVHAYDSATVHAYDSAATHRHAPRAKVSGGVVIEVPDVRKMTAAEWCAYRGVTVKRGRATLYKALDDDLSTQHARLNGLVYAVGKTVTAPDWKPTRECGNGLHASPTPWRARDYNDGATRYVAVSAPVDSLVVLDDKVKAPRLRVLYECDLDGERLA